MQLLGIFALELMKRHLISTENGLSSKPQRRGCRTPASRAFESTSSEMFIWIELVFINILFIDCNFNHNNKAH